MPCQVVTGVRAKIILNPSLTHKSFVTLSHTYIDSEAVLRALPDFWTVDYSKVVSYLALKVLYA